MSVITQINQLLQCLITLYPNHFCARLYDIEVTLDR